ncbi:MAG: class I SAM-dependent methyltransferase [Telluria sp.]
MCGNITSSGLLPWHSTCRHCNYERADLAPHINNQAADALLNEGDGEAALRALRTENFKVIVDEAVRFAVPGPKRLLDVGSAHGWFLEAAADQFEVLGVEPDDTLARHSLSRGLPVRTGYFPDALTADETFDVIVFNDVIEHIPDVGAALGRASVATGTAIAAPALLQSPQPHAASRQVRLHAGSLL